MPKLHFASTKDPDMFYLVPKKIADPFFLLEKSGKRHIFLNALEIGAFSEQNRDENTATVDLGRLCTVARSLQIDATPLQKIALALCKEHDLLEQPIGVSKHFPLDLADFLRSQKITLIVTDPFLPRRRTKSAEEIAHIRSSVQRTCTAFERIERVLREARISKDTLVYKNEVLTSEYLKHEVEKLLFESGMESSDGIIISSGAHAAMPHHSGTGPIRPHQTIVCDIFPRDRQSGYFADVSRTFVKGSPDTRSKKMYNAVKTAQEEAEKAVKAGVRAADVHALAANRIKAAGFESGEQGFIHSLGHGVGLEVHEAPGVGPSAKENLEAGDVITVEPGLYYPGGGVRLEDVLVVTEDGSENLSPYPKRLAIS